MAEQLQSKFGGIPVAQAASVSGSSRFGGIPVATPGATFMTSPNQEPASLTKRLGGSAEAALTLATGFPAQAAAGIGGIYDLVSGMVSGRKDAVDTAANRVNQISQAMTYQPRSQSGQDILEMVSVPFQKLDELTTSFGNAVLADTGSPALATAAKVGIEAAPAAMFGRTPRSIGERRSDINRVESDLRASGINLDDSMNAQRGQLSDMAARSTQGQQIRAQEMARVQQAVQTAERVADANVASLYDAARQTNAAVPVTALSSLPQAARAALVDYDIDMMPIVQKRLGELDQINARPGNYSVRLNELEKYRRRINRNRPAANDLSQQAALGIIKGQVDGMLDAAFNANMIKGDPAGIQAWRDARGAFIDYKRTFDEDKVINQLATQKATPEEVRNWVFGASAVGAKKEAGRVIGSLKGILGENSPAFGSLRQEALFDVMEPLLREVPDYAGYVANYDKFVRSSPTVANELFPDSIGELKTLRDYASAANRVSPQTLTLDANQTIARAIFGHGIAKAGMKVSIASQVLGLLRRASGKSEKQQIISEILGYDTTQPLIPLSPAFVGAGIQTGIDQGQQNGN